MALYLLKIQDYITDWKRVGGYKFIKDEDIPDFVMDEDLFLEVTQNQWNAIRNLIDAGSTLTYPVSATDDGIQQEDFTIESVTPLKAAKIKAYSNVSFQVNQRLLSSGSMINIFKFVIADNILRNGGYTITDDNREQVYLDIVNAGVQKYITALEVYLDVKDRLSEDLWFMDNFLTFEDRLRSATTVEEVQTIYDTAMGYFD